MNDLEKAPNNVPSEADIIPASLPLLERATEYIYLNRPEARHALEGRKILLVQHLLGSTIPLLSTMEEFGAKPEDTYIVGKAYSSHPDIVMILSSRGYHVTLDDVFDHRDDEPYDSMLETHIEEATSSLVSTMGSDKGLLVDDGGKAIRLIHQTFLAVAERFACVEQTSRGARVVSTLNPTFPVVNVARSEAKTVYESPAIAKAMVTELIESLSEWSASGVFNLTNNNVLVLGYGFIGEEIAREFTSRRFAVSVYDPDKEKRNKAFLQGVKVIVNREQACQNVGLIVGCTGNEVLSESESSELRENTLLANMGSTDTEFGAWKLRPRGSIIHQRVLPSDVKYLKKFMPLSWRSLYKIDSPNGAIYLANGGYPTDFSGKVNPVPTKDIQLTSSLLLGGLIQSVYEKAHGLVDLDSAFQKYILDEYQKLNNF